MAKVKLELMVKNVGYEGLILVDFIQRLGIDYAFREEIQQVLKGQYIAMDQLVKNKDLYFVSLCFRLFRQHHYSISAGYFFFSIFFFSSYKTILAIFCIKDDSSYLIFMRIRE